VLTLSELIQERQQVAPFVLVPGRDSGLERQPAAVYQEVDLGPGLAAQRARDLLAPFFASTSDASAITRDQSKRSCSASWSCNTTNTRSKRPRCCHSANRRRHVSPLGNPSSL